MRSASEKYWNTAIAEMCKRNRKFSHVQLTEKIKPHNTNIRKLFYTNKMNEPSGRIWIGSLY